MGCRRSQPADTPRQPPPPPRPESSPGTGIPGRTANTSTASTIAPVRSSFPAVEVAASAAAAGGWPGRNSVGRSQPDGPTPLEGARASRQDKLFLSSRRAAIVSEGASRMEGAGASRTPARRRQDPPGPTRKPAAAGSAADLHRLHAQNQPRKEDSRADGQHLHRLHDSPCTAILSPAVEVAASPTRKPPGAGRSRKTTPPRFGARCRNPHTRIGARICAPAHDIKGQPTRSAADRIRASWPGPQECRRRPAGRDGGSRSQGQPADTQGGFQSLQGKGRKTTPPG